MRPCDADTRVFIGDSMGELTLFLAAADVAFVGGSLVPHGGHNLLEPAALGIPAVTGPHVFNFTEICELLLQAGACEKVESVAGLAATLGRWLGDANERHRVGEQGRLVVEKNRGALQAVLAMVDRHLLEQAGQGSP
jgi:3-deoxy-D-manno-octulosonic-acid transferase